MVRSPAFLRSLRPQDVVAGLVVILIVGFSVRLFGLNWDDATYLHPDERHVVADVLVGRINLEWPPDVSSLIDPATSTINPRPLDVETGAPERFAYGTFPLYMTELAAEAFSQITGDDWHAYGRVHYLGRVFTLLLDTATILLTFLLTRQIAGSVAALIAAACYALAPIAIQLAHFFTSESWITFFVTLSLLGAVRGARLGYLRSFVLAGSAAGLALASKSSVAGVVVPIAVAVMWDYGRRLAREDETVAATNAMLARATIACTAFLVCFALGEPFALLDAAAYLDSLRLQVQIQSGAFDVPFTRQYVGTIRGWYQFDQMLRWGLGPVIGVLAFGGMLALIVAFVKNRQQRAGLVVILSWLAVYGLALLIADSKFLRYMLPAVPVLSLGAGLLAHSCIRWALNHMNRRLALITLTTTAAIAIGWTVAFASIYARPHPRLAASAWLFEHAAPGSSTSSEVWDDRLPISAMPGLDGLTRRFDAVDINLYQDFPTLADARHLTTAFAASDVSAPLVSLLAREDYASAAQLLEGSLTQQLLNMGSDDRLKLSGELSRAASRMTTSRELRATTTSAAQSLLRPDGSAEAAWSSFASDLGMVPARTAQGYLYDALSRTDYYVVSSNRVMTGIAQAPWRYPVQARFYEMLFEERLGFRLEKEFTSYPRLGNLIFPDDTADETFINYDHPHVWIFAKEQLPDQQAFAQLMAPASLLQTEPQRTPPDDDALVFDRPVGQLPVVDDARWSSSLTSNSWWALAVWIVLLMGLQVAGAPLASIVYGGFPDRGWAAARLLSLLVAGWIVWLLASLQAIAFRSVWCGVALAAVALLGWLLRSRLAKNNRGGTKSYRTRFVAISELVFWATFSLFLLFRYLNPDSWHPFWGGEKPMEFAHLNAVLRSAHFPPVDPWYAGGYLNYYYYGTYLVAFMIKLTGIPSEIAFNLAQPTVVALIASMTFSVVAALGRRLSSRPGLAIVAGLAGVILVSFAGNLLAAKRVVQAAFDEMGLVTSWDFWVWDASRVIPFTINEFPYFTALYADMHAHVIAWPITILVIGLAYAIARDRRSLALAFTAPTRFHHSGLTLLVRLTLLGLAIGSLGPTNAWDVATYAALILVAIFAATAGIRPTIKRIGVATACIGFVACVGMLAYLPFHLHYVALFRSLGTIEPESTTPLDTLLLHFGAPMAVLLFGLILLAPESSPRRHLSGTLGPLVLVVILAAFALVNYTSTNAPAHSDVSAALAVAAFGITLLATFIIPLLSRRKIDLSRVLATVLVALASVGVLFALQTGRPAMALYVSLGCAAVVAWLMCEQPTERFIAALTAGGMLLGALLEILFLVDNLAETLFFRMNTVFKFYNQLWVLFAISSGALVARMIDRGWPATRAASGPSQPPSPASTGTPRGAPSSLEREYQDPAPSIWARCALVVTGIAVLLTIAYPLTATLPRLETRFASHLGSRTLNALDWMDYGTIPMTDGSSLAFTEDRAVIDWFNSSVTGTPVLAEAAFGAYRCNGSRISIATGLPAVIGWVNHQTQQRDADDLWAREDDLQTLYTEPDVRTKREIIDRYGIEYIVVGQMERSYPRIDGGSCEPQGSGAGINAFTEMVGTSLEVAFRSGSTVVYRVI